MRRLTFWHENRSSYSPSPRERECGIRNMLPWEAGRSILMKFTALH